MRTYKQYIIHPYDGFRREETEWSNLWYDKANQKTEQRYLLIGDSTVRMVRSTFSKITGCPVDMIGSSSDVDDILFVNQVDSFFATKMYKYDAIFVQIGHHSRESRGGGSFQDADLQRFTVSIKALVDFLKQYSSNIILESIFDSVVYKSTRFDSFLIQSGLKQIFIKTKLFGYITKIGIRKEKKDYDINRVTDAKSRVLRELSKELNIKWLDINALVQMRKFAHIDHIHFEERAKYYIAYEMNKCL